MKDNQKLQTFFLVFLFLSSTLVLITLTHLLLYSGPWLEPGKHISGMAERPLVALRLPNRIPSWALGACFRLQRQDKTGRQLRSMLDFEVEGGSFA